eukprot:CAMPEP_0172406318 /NCGR_PEP_ID=MMETSP1061-20121228/70261_1 /TAXON_ID=37318 /ORGANISM="Pseudo-nitzschia pungens, Strain cf. pungens" /LENGTH=67 /DNA_ID=CAMNT_0013141873 /DNA_START=48 /DNA_END=248 /DNA_ORIENTATION=-
MTSTSKHSATAWALVAVFAWTFVEGVLEYLGKRAGNRAAEYLCDYETDNTAGVDANVNGSTKSRREW